MKYILTLSIIVFFLISSIQCEPYWIYNNQNLTDALKLVNPGDNIYLDGIIIVYNYVHYTIYKNNDINMLIVLKIIKRRKLHTRLIISLMWSGMGHGILR